MFSAVHSWYGLCNKQKHEKSVLLDLDNCRLRSTSNQSVCLLLMCQWNVSKGYCVGGIRTKNYLLRQFIYVVICMDAG